MYKSTQRKRDYNKLYYQDRKEELKARARRRYHENRQVILYLKKRSYKKNKEKMREYNREIYKKRGADG